MSELSKKKQGLDQGLCTSKKEMGECERALKKLKLEVGSLTEEKSILEAQIATQKQHVKQAEPDKKKVEEMMRKVDSFRYGICPLFSFIVKWEGANLEFSATFTQFWLNSAKF